MKTFLISVLTFLVLSEETSAQILRPRREPPRGNNTQSTSPNSSKTTCPIATSYDSASAYAPDFRIRSGYSRNNDDAPEGSYETAVFDFELIGRWDPIEKAYCLALVVESFLSEEWENASRWSSQFYLSSYSLLELDLLENRWKNTLNESRKFSPVPLTAREHAVSQASYLQNKKYDFQSDLDDVIHNIQNKRARDIKKASLRTYSVLGWFKPGFYLGRNFLQRPTSRKGNLPGFENTDPASYITVRHTIEWRLSLGEEGKILDPKKLLFMQSAGKTQIDETKDAVDFTNYIKLIKPVWHNQVVTIENGSKELKKHVAKLMWKDLVLKNELYEDVFSLNSKEERSGYSKYNMLFEMQARPELNWGEEIGRLPRKANKQK